MDSYIWTHQCWLTSKDLHPVWEDIRWNLEELPKVMDDRDGWWGWVIKSVLSVQLEDENLKGGHHRFPPNHRSLAPMNLFRNILVGELKTMVNY